jgi:hypothetical protein
MGTMQQIDSSFLWVENGPQSGITATQGAALIMATLSATQTLNGADQINTIHKGAVFWVNVIGSVNATVSVRINIQAKNDLLGTYITIASLSLASIDTTSDGSVGNQSLWVFPNATATASIANVSPVQIPRTYRVQASITTQATATTRVVRMEIGQNKML